MNDSKSTMNIQHKSRDVIVGTAKENREHKDSVFVDLFFTFYNGMSDYPAEEVLRLSDAFRTAANDNSVELKVKVININLNKNHGLLERCEVLKQYSTFMDKIREYQAAGEPDAIKQAIRECIRDGVLADYLTRKGSEVTNMLIAEYSYETDIRVKQEEAREDGIELGKRLGQQQGQQLKVVQQICKKIKKGKTIEEIADDLEENPEDIRDIYETALQFAPDYDCELIYKKMLGEDQENNTYN